MKEPDSYRCALCGCDVSRVTRRHIVPKSEGGTLTIDLCSACHKTLHSFFTNETLAKELSSIDALRQDPDLQRYLAWVRRQPDRAVKVHSRSKKR